MSSRASLNHVYRTVWNEALGAMVAVAEIASAGGHGTNAGGRRRDHRPGAVARLSALALGIAAAWLAGPANVLANPSGGSAIVGQASMVNQGNKLTVTTQNGALGSYSAINWQSFSIPAGSTTYFQQPSTSSTSINRVVTNNPSQIFGTLGSNGNLVLVNQSGITVGAGAVVDSAGFTASSLRMSDADALAARMRFGDGTAAGAGVSVQGSILARSGDVVLLGSQLDTGKDALIQAPNGSTILAAGRQIEITGRGLEGISLQVQAPTDSAVNLGSLQGDAVGIFAGTLRHSGLIQATTATLEGGRVVLKAGGDAYVQGAGTINVSSASGKGGQIAVLGKRVAVTDDAVLDASGATGGGTVLVGGDKQGKNPDVQNAEITYFGPQASIKADATIYGDGGKVIVWADDTTRAYGRISAQGGPVGGNGGFVETSGHSLAVDGVRVSTGAPRGTSGLWLLDPSDLTIISGGGGTLTTSTTFNPSVSSSTIDPSVIVGSNPGYGGLVDGNVTISTSAGTGGYGGIIVSSGLTWSSGNSLTLNADGNIILNATITANPSNLGYGGAVVLKAAGSLTFGYGGSITSAAAGDAVVMVVGGTFNAGYAGTISTPTSGGRWLAYLKDPGSHLFPVNSPPQFKQYNAAFGATVLGTGNGVLYNNTTPAVLTAGQSAPLDALTGAVSKVYDGGLAIGMAGATYSSITGGVIDGDTLSAGAASGGTGSLSDPNVGTGKLVTASNVNVAGLVGGNGIATVYGYQIRGLIGEVTQVPVTPVITINSISMNGSRVYDGTNIVNADIFSLSGLVGGETLTLSGSGTVADKNVGVNKPVSLGSLTLGNGTGLASNYSFDGGSQLATITRAPVTASGITASSKVYDGTTVAAVTGGSLLGVVSGDSLALSLGAGNFNDKNVGIAKPVTVTGLALRGADAVNYALTSSSASLSADITPKGLTVSGVTAANKVYDGSTLATLSGGVLSGVVSGDSLSLGAASGSFNDKNIGKAKAVTVTGLTLAGADAANYTLGSSNSLSADITPKDLAVSVVTAASKVYDGSTAATLSGGVLSGAVAGDAVTLGTPTGTFSDKNIGLGKTVAITGLTLSGSDAPNYTLGSVTSSTSADITPKAVTASPVSAANKVYDGSTAATLSGGVLSGAVAGDAVALGLPSGTFSDKNAGLGKTVAITGLSLSGSDATNYTLGGVTTSTTADISKAAITAISGIVVNDKVYDGKTTTTVLTSSANLAGMVAGDQLTVGSVESVFVDRNVGRGKVVNLSNLTLSGQDAANYTVPVNITPVSGNITVRPLATWTAPGSGQWSTAANWDALPDASNVLAVAIPAGVTVAYDAAVGATQLQSVSGNFSLAGGSLSIAGGLSTAQYGQTGGALSLGAAFTVNGSFSQTGGTIAAIGPVAITQGSGNLTVGAINAPSISLSAPTGSISQSAALVTPGLLSTRSLGSTLLTDAGNRVGSFNASSTGVGDIALTSVGAIDVQGINAATGNVTLFNTGGISTSGPVLANGGAVSMTANSPLTIGTGGISAMGNIDLLASNLTSAGNLTLNGDLLSIAGAISLTAANNFVQNAGVSAALGVTVSAGGSVTLGPLAHTFSNAISYGVNGVSVATPPGSQTTGSTPTDFVATFMTQFERAIVVSAVFGVDPLLPTRTDRRAIAVEGDICSR